METEDILALLKFFTDLPGIAQILLVVPVLVYLGIKYHSYLEYVSYRVGQTNTRIYSYADTVLRNILSESITNMRNIVISARGGADNITQEDRAELQLCRSSSALALLVETKQGIKSFFNINGYIDKIRSNINIDDIVHDRACTLRDSTADIIDSVVRTSSPLYNNSETRFSKEKGVVLYRSLIDNHYQEVLQEEMEINQFIKDNFGFLSRFLKYKH